jgi:chemotaxis protein CheD
LERRMTVAQLDTIVVGMGELQVSNDPQAVLTCLGLGSCIGFAAYDPLAKAAGMVHIVLPDSSGKMGVIPGKFADTALPALIEAMEKLGAEKRRMVVKIAGGAQMSLVAGSAGIFKTGERNLEATEIAAAEQGLKIASADVGGHSGRTLRLYVESGKVTVTTAGTETKDL